MPGYTSISFQNILLTLKKYQEGTFELLYISSEVRNLIGQGEKFYEESFFNTLFPTLPQKVFEFLFASLGTGERFICPIILNGNLFRCVQIEGYVIAQEDHSYLINVLISPIEWNSNIKFSWLINKHSHEVYTGIQHEAELKNSQEVLQFICRKFEFIKEDILLEFFKKKGSGTLPIFPNHLYLQKTSLTDQYCLLELTYSPVHGESKFVDELPDLIFYEYESKDDKLLMSGATEKITGYPDTFFSTISGKKWENLVHPEDLHLYQSHLNKVGKFTYRFLHRSGYYIFLEEEIRRTDEKNGLLLGVISDVTALKEIEKDLLQKKSVLDELTGVVPGMVYLMKTNSDLSHNFLYISEGCKNLLGLDPKSIISNESNFSSLVHPEDIDGLLTIDREAYLEDKKFEAYFRIITPKGEEKWLYGASNRLKQYHNESIWAGIFVDFTYTKQKELESIQNWQWYKTLFEENPLPIFQYDKEGKILEVNRSFIEKIDIKDKNLLVGKNLFDFLGKNPIRSAYKQSLKEGFARYEGPYVSHFNNKLFHLRMTSKTIDAGETFQAILEDISDQQYIHNIISQLTEKTSRLGGKAFFDELTKFLSNKLEMSHCFIAEVDSKIKQAKIISSYKNGKKGDNYVYKLENSPCLDCLEKNEPHIVLSNAKSLYPKDEGLQKMDISTYMGVPITDINQVKLGILVLMDEKARPYNLNLSSFLKILADRIGAEMVRINYEQKLVSSEMLFRSIAENFPKGTVEVLDKNLIYVYAEGKEFKDMGINPRDLIGTPHLSKYGDYISNELRKYLDKVLLGESVMFEVFINEQYYLKSGVPLENNSGEIDRILLVTQNITETKLAEEEREQLIRDLKSQNEELQRFAYITSHNLRAPIVNITSLLELYDDKNPQNPENKEVIENLKISTSILNGTLDDLIEVVSIKKNKVPKIERIDFGKLTKNVEKSLSKQLRDAKAIIHQDFSEVPVINYIYSHLENFLINLTTNALKYKHPERTPVIKISTYLKNNFVVLEFEDNGIGIDLERYGDRLFGLYQRFHSHVEGKGLGLYLVREQIRAHDGNLKVESSVGKGTTFKIYLKNLKSPELGNQDYL
ncbi:PAS domain S-box protein [Cecembia lonarensis]|uniref:histidine kinase n=1 Tax=Cecembia lonarensis (strain CCUG 58316 / KCTC 22772 / LW9) TaxID=1225176 RepID=K1LAG6_CECL9|nr:PAS domain S-box protein [Cecembia lonarensis]EKB49222.1 Phytochrome-like protein cph1 [Cecembia lonarensis LW9]